MPWIQAVEKHVASLLFRVPAWALPLLYDPHKAHVDGQTLAPELQLLLAGQRLRPGNHGLTAGSVQQARTAMRRDILAFGGPEIRVQAVRELSVQGAAGPLRARLYTPETRGEKRPLLVFLHGGGFVLGDLDTHDAPCRMLCRDARVHVLSVEYRLAPEHPFPAAPNDAYSALCWAQEHAEELGADPARVAIGGDSAGGNLSAGVTQRAAREGRAPCLQLLIYPGTCRVTPRPSLELFGDGYYLTRADMHCFDGHYMGRSEALYRDPRVSPALAENLSELSPALVVTAGFDPLRDEGEAYAHALREAGNRVDMYREPSLLHGFINMVGVSESSRAAVKKLALRLHSMLESL